MRVGAWRALLPAILAAACTDALWCHAFPSRMTAVILATLTANAWRNWGDVHAFGGIAISVVACGTASWLGSALETPLAGLSFVGWKMLLTQLLWCLPMLPIVATIFDACFQRQLAWYSILAAESPEEDAADD